jgi:hypothetical protein
MVKGSLNSRFLEGLSQRHAYGGILGVYHLSAPSMSFSGPETTRRRTSHASLLPLYGALRLTLRFDFIQKAREREESLRSTHKVRIGKGPVLLHPSRS